MKKALYILGLFVFFSSVMTVTAATLTLTKVGTTSTVGLDYSNISYNGSIPLFVGVASPSAVVSIMIKTSTDATTAASTSGAWQFRPGVMDPGVNAIVISSGSEVITFNLNLNATVSATPTATPTEEPEELLASGVWEYLMPMAGMGMVVVFFGKFLKDSMHRWEGKR